jgi:hypothetical protein
VPVTSEPGQRDRSGGLPPYGDWDSYDLGSFLRPHGVRRHCIDFWDGPGAVAGDGHGRATGWKKSPPPSKTSPAPSPNSPQARQPGRPRYGPNSKQADQKPGCGQPAAPRHRTSKQARISRPTEPSTPEAKP